MFSKPIWVRLFPLLIFQLFLTNSMTHSLIPFVVNPRMSGSSRKRQTAESFHSIWPLQIALKTKSGTAQWQTLSASLVSGRKYIQRAFSITSNNP